MLLAIGIAILALLTVPADGAGAATGADCADDGAGAATGADCADDGVAAAPGPGAAPR